MQSFVAEKDALGPSFSLKQGLVHKGFLWKFLCYPCLCFIWPSEFLPNLLNNPTGINLVFKELIVSKNSEMLPSNQCSLPALATDHTRPQVEIINLINLKLPVEHVSLTLISRTRTDTSKGLCYIMRACDMFKTIHQRAHVSTLWCFVYAKEESCSSHPQLLMLKLILK